MGSYLVTGVAGFIGAAVAQRLLAGGHRVIGIDNLSTGFRHRVPEGTEFFEGGCEQASIYRVIPLIPYDAIFHIAGQSSGENSFNDPVYDLQTNTQSTLLLLSLAREVGCRNVIFASSMSVYGQQQSQPVSESAPALPLSFYGVGKLASEHYLRLYAGFGISTTALRLFNVYGPRQNMENMLQGMMSIYLRQALRSRHVVVKGSADRFRDFVYIDDVVEAFLLASQRRSDAATVVNIGTGVPTTVAQLLDELRAALPFEFTTAFDPPTPGDQFGIFADHSLAARELAWRPRTGLRDGLRAMVQWAMADNETPR